ncbi:Membrane protein involved in the export of O-antigen and teichoic acid [Alkalibacterium gilvum]|uniref:Membrane protein involved in the export of O-antigen and teichoic acid n=1 Tax=Alkalibacterium gilvum TaxID=1130080 RepID=A0A1H6TA20_9LACT|nr:oligosaccharide flippase family protein [Alkalibacterium gilvum]SEI76889.1 Membrane protein involved in the export of O-antigen and teichoic acid [Alkalibacterium gilvum]
MNSSRSNKRLRNNIVYSSLYQLLVFIVPIITTPYVTRIFDSTQMGEYSLTLSIASLFVILSQFGIETFGIREVAKLESKTERDELFFKLVSIQFIISILVFAIYNIIFVVWMESQSKQLFFVQSLLILSNIFDISWFYIGIEEIKKTILRNVMAKVFITVSIFLFIKDSNQLITYSILNVIGMLIGNLTMVISSRHYIDYNNMKFSLKKDLLLGSFYLLIPRVLNSSYGSIENTILRVQSSSSNVGIYAQAKKIDNLIFSVIESAINALSPRMSYYVSKKDNENINRILEKGLFYSNIFSVIFVSGILAVSNDFVNFFFGAGYDMVAPVLSILSVSLIFLPIISLLNRGILIPFNKDKEYSISIIIILFTGSISNILLSPLYGAIGAAIAYNITRFSSLVYLLTIVNDIINVKKIILSIITSFILVSINYFSVRSIAEFLTIENAVISFLIFGLISLTLNLLSYTLFYLSNLIINNHHR